MNGIIEINVGGSVYPLRFGMLAVELIGQQQVINPSHATIKMLMDIVYAGMANASTIKGETAKTYEQTSEIVEQLLEQEDGQVTAIWKCFEESKTGSKMLTGVKKKLEETQNQSL